mgnify:CR=1 FL=1
MTRFTLPRDIYHGKGSLESLKTFEGKKAMICVGGGSMKRFGFLDRAIGYLKEAGMEVEVFDGIESDPSVETVMRGADAMLKFEPDWIVAIGGGSPIDAAIIAGCGRNISLYRVGYCVHACVCHKLFGHCFGKLGVNNGNVGRDFKIGNRVFYTFLIIGNYRKCRNLCCSARC